MRAFNGGDLRVQRTRSGYIAVLRVQGADGSVVGLVGRCSDAEARAHLQGVGFSFAGIAKAIGKAAKGIAKSKVFKSFVSMAKMLPPPLSAVASVAEGAAKTLAGMKRGDPKALKVWKAAAARARLNPTSPTAAGMRLAIDASGPPRFRSEGDTKMANLVREVLAELEQRGTPDARPADPTPPAAATAEAPTA